MQDYRNPYLGVDNPYLARQIDNAQGDLVRNFNLVAQPSYNAAMLRSGSFGNSGVDEMNRNAQLNLQNSMGRIANDMRFNDYQQQQQMYQWDQGFNRNLYNDAYAQQQQDLQTQLGLLDRTQAYDTTALNNATNIQNTPLNYWQQFANGANAIGSGYGISTTQTPGGGSNPWVTALGGAQLGNALFKALGWGGDGGWGGWGGNTSLAADIASPGGGANFQALADSGYM